MPVNDMEQERQAGPLEVYCERIVQDPTVAPPTGLDPKVVTTVQLVARGLAVPQPGARFAKDLQRRLTAQAMMLASSRSAEPSAPSQVTTAVHCSPAGTVVRAGRWWTLPAWPRLQRMAVATIAALLLVASLFAVSPQARVFAQSSLENLLAQFGFTRAPRERPTAAATPPAAGSAWSAPIPEPTRQPATPRPALTREEVQAEVGFAVEEPTHLPIGYREAAPLTPFTDGARKWVTWHAAPVERKGCEVGISLVQEPVPPQTSLRPQIALGDSPVTMVIVADAPGLWIEGFAESQCDSLSADGKTLVTTTGTGNLLVWDQDGVRYHLTASSSLGLEQVLKVAESLRGDGTAVTPVPGNPELQGLHTPRPILGQVPGQRLQGKLVITFEGESYAGWWAYASDEIDPAHAQGYLFAPAIAALRDAATPTGWISDRGDTLGQRYVVVEIWQRQVNVGTSGGDVRLREMAAQGWAQYFENALKQQHQP